jgi:hypothetical protein
MDKAFAANQESAQVDKMQTFKKFEADRSGCHLER